ncbi:MAG: hypothetical protein EA425_14815, partial [Puniceicoccaceae bacterium]
MLADKICGNQAGVWLLVPEHLRLGTWDLLCAWSGCDGRRVEPRLALHLVNEAAMCLCSHRCRRTLSQKGFELANGLPFVPADAAVHQLLDARSVAQSRRVQIALGKLRRAAGHFDGRLLALDPHRMPSHSKRRMRRHRFGSQDKPAKMGQSFFLLDCDTAQPLCMSLASSSPTAAESAPGLLSMAAEILPAAGRDEAKPLVLADKEHCTSELFAAVRRDDRFELLCAMPASPSAAKRWKGLAESEFTEHWPGYATALSPYRFAQSPGEVYHEVVQRSGLRPQDHHHQGFLATCARDQLQR